MTTLDPVRRSARELRPLSLRTIAIIPIVLFAPTLAIATSSPGSKASSMTGILFHLSVLFVVSRLPSPDWARAAGYAWLALDVTCGAMLINGVPFEIAWPVRLGGHVMAMMWIIPTSFRQSATAIRVVGVVVGLWLALYTFFGHTLPTSALGPAGVLTVVWFGLVAWKSGRSTGAGDGASEAVRTEPPVSLTAATSGGPTGRR